MAILTLSLLEMTLSPAEAGTAKGAAKAIAIPAATHVRRVFPYTSRLDFALMLRAALFPDNALELNNNPVSGTGHG